MAKAPKIRLVRLRGRNQITLPPAVISALSVEEGDYLAAVLDDDGIVRLRPAKLATAGTRDAEKSIERAEQDIAQGRSQEYASVDEFKSAMLASHEKELAEETPDEGPALLVHVGEKATSASVSRDGVPIFTRNIDLGSSNDKAELAEEVFKTVQFFNSAVEGPGIASIFLSAGPPPVPGLAEALSEKVHLNVRELTPAAPTLRLRDYVAGQVPSFLFNPHKDTKTWAR